MAQVSPRERELLAKKEQATLQAETMEASLGEAETELKTHTEHQKRYQQLQQVLHALKELEQLNGLSLFFGDDLPPTEQARKQRRLQRQVDNYEEELERLQLTRDQFADQAKKQRLKVKILGEDIAEVRRYYGEQEAEVVLKMSPLSSSEDRYSFHRTIMPWAFTQEDQKRIWFSQLGVFLLALLCALLFFSVEIEEPEQSDVIEVPERLAQLLNQQQKSPPPPPPPPPPPQKEAEPEPKPEPKPEEAKVEKPKPEVKRPRKKAPKAVTEKAKKAREKVKSVGILALSDNLQEELEASEQDALKALRANRQQQRSNVGGRRATRSLITSKLPGGSSGGVQTAALSRNVTGVGGGSGSGRAVAKVATAIGTGDKADAGRQGDREGNSGRSDEEIQLVFDRNKSRIYRLYNRELRKNPTLKGKIVLKLTIEPDGSVSAASIVSSELPSESLSKRILAYIKRMSFGNKPEAEQITINYPIDFFPT